MHDTAVETGQQFFKVYLGDLPEPAILEVGSLNVNGTLRDCAPAGSHYTGVDLEPGDGVDMVLTDPHVLPFGDDGFDAVVSTSCFEHNPMFWLTFTEVVRVTKPGGVIYISAPSNGWYHRYPTDNWRFYPDAGLGLERWAQHQGYEIRLLESFIARRRDDEWNDCIMIFERGPAGDRNPGRVCDGFPDAMNVRRSNRPDDLSNFVYPSEDQETIYSLKEQLAERDARIAALEQELESARTGDWGWGWGCALDPAPAGAARSQATGQRPPERG